MGNRGDPAANLPTGDLVRTLLADAVSLRSHPDLQLLRLPRTGRVHPLRRGRHRTFLAYKFGAPSIPQPVPQTPWPEAAPRTGWACQFSNSARLHAYDARHLQGKSACN